MAVESSWFPEKSYTGFKAVPITIKQIDSAEICHASESVIQAFPANSVGVFPVTCRKAWENAGTLA